MPSALPAHCCGRSRLCQCACGACVPSVCASSPRMARGHARWLLCSAGVIQGKGWHEWQVRCPDRVQVSCVVVLACVHAPVAAPLPVTMVENSAACDWQGARSPNMGSSRMPKTASTHCCGHSHLWVWARVRHGVRALVVCLLPTDGQGPCTAAATQRLCYMEGAATSCRSVSRLCPSVVVPAGVHAPMVAPTSTAVVEVAPPALAMCARGRSPKCRRMPPAAAVPCVGHPRLCPRGCRGWGPSAGRSGLIVHSSCRILVVGPVAVVHVQRGWIRATATWYARLVQ